jgi:hypothetical protein
MEVTDDLTEEEFARRVIHIMRDRGFQLPRNQTNGEKKALSWILGLATLLLVAGIIGDIAMFGKVSEHEVMLSNVAELARRQDEHMQSIDRKIDQLLERRQ